MSAILTVTQHWSDGKRNHVIGNIVLSGSYTTNGIPLSLLVDQLLSSQPVVYSDVVGLAGYYQYSSGSLYAYRYVPAPITDPTVLNDGLLKIFSGGAELSPGALPAAVLADTITFYGIFRKF